MKTKLKEINGRQIRRPWYVGKRWLKTKIQMERMPEEIFFDHKKEGEIEVVEKNCTFFGCGKILSMREGMFGNRCISHPIGMKNFNNLPL